MIFTGNSENKNCNFYNLLEVLPVPTILLLANWLRFPMKFFPFSASLLTGAVLLLASPGQAASLEIARSVAVAVAVPEPSGSMLAVSILLFLIGRRYRA
jgi:hypothetical protein